MKIATLGPEGTFSHQAVQKIDRGCEIVFTKTIKDIFLAVEAGEADKGVVPVENSIGGAVSLTLDALNDHDLTVELEEVIPVQHCLMAEKDALHSDIKKLFVHEQTYAQCEEYIRKNMSNVEVCETTSNAESARRAGAEEAAAAIGPEIAAEIYGLTVLAKGVQDYRYNVTRFFLISNEATSPTGKDKTTITVYPQVDRPGLLFDILGTFKTFGINLSKIESRPAGGKLGDYIFYLDFEGHAADKNVVSALKELQKDSFVKVLGSYPRKY